MDLAPPACDDHGQFNSAVSVHDDDDDTWRSFHSDDSPQHTVKSAQHVKKQGKTPTVCALTFLCDDAYSVHKIIPAQPARVAFQSVIIIKFAGCASTMYFDSSRALVAVYNTPALHCSKLLSGFEFL